MSNTTVPVPQRAHLRIRYPRCGAIGQLPKITFEGSDAVVDNISAGGACIDIQDEEKWTSFGDTFELQFIFSEPVHQFPVTGRTVGAVHFKRHLQFVDPDRHFLIRLHKAIEPGINGNGYLQRSLDKKQTQELWEGPRKEKLLLADFGQDDGLPLAEWQKDKHLIQIFESEPARILPWNEETSEEQGNLCSLEEYDDFLLTLVNIPDPTDRLFQMQLLAESQRPWIMEANKLAS